MFLVCFLSTMTVFCWKNVPICVYNERLPGCWIMSRLKHFLLGDPLVVLLPPPPKYRKPKLRPFNLKLRFSTGSRLIFRERITENLLYFQFFLFCQYEFIFKRVLHRIVCGSMKLVIWFYRKESIPTSAFLR